MSGGRFNYAQSYIWQIVEDIETIIANNNSTDRWGDRYELSEAVLQKLEEAIPVLKAAYVYAQRIDWFISGDDGEDTFFKRLASDLEKVSKGGNTSKHTPGPWEVIDSFSPSVKEIKGPSFTIAATMWATDLTEKDYQNRRADLHLIAAAPDLLEALKSIVGDSSIQRVSDDLHKKARAAIAKAKGEA